MRKTRLTLFLVTLFLASSHFTVAGSIQTTLDVVANVVAGCSNVTATGVDFGNVAAGSNPYFANGDVTVTCESGVNYNIALDQGLHSPDGLRRWMVNATADFAEYELFQSASLTEIWGDGDTPPGNYVLGNSLADTGDGSPQPHTVFGKTTDISSAVEGAYSDTVAVTVYF